jgi:hypothetical protein
MITIEDVIEINSKLSTWNLIYRHFPIKWKIFGSSIIVIGLMCFLSLMHYSVNDRYWVVIFFFFISLFLGICFSKFIFKKERIIIEQKYPYAILEFPDSRDKRIRKIQKEEFKKLFQNNNIFHKENLLFLIDCITKENESIKFKYPISINFFIMVLGSLFFGTFLSGFVNFTDDKLDEYLYFYKIVFALIFGILCSIFCIEKTIIKEIVDTRRKNRNRLIRILENIYLEMHL